MATIIKKKKKNQFYYYLVESARIDGKPRIVHQQYLGRAEEIAKKCSRSTDLDTPKYSIAIEFGAVCALYEIARELGVIELIDKYVKKRNQDLSIGAYMLIAAINRAVAPASKLQIADWYAKTMLKRLLPAEKRMLSSQRFWDNMSLLSDTAIEEFENAFTELIVSRYNLATDCLIYDATNFFTYIDTESESELPQRGHSKEKRFDLKIIGLAMMVTPDFNVPLFHEVYPGNRADAVEFDKALAKLKERFTRVCGAPRSVTLVFDKGNNSGPNIERVFEEDPSFHVVGSLKGSEHKDLLDIPKKQFQPVSEHCYQGVTAYRVQRQVYGKEMTVLVVHNPELLSGQMQGIMHNIEKCVLLLGELQRSLLKRTNGEVTKGRKPTVSSVEKRASDILHPEFMVEIFDVTVTADHDGVHLDFAFNNNKLEHIQERFLGKTILFTDNHHWTDERILAAYRSQYHIEDAFKQMKNTKFLHLRPIYHWTDQKIRVHAFYCVLALRLCCLLQRNLHDHGIDLSLNKMLSSLSEIQQIITVYPKQGASKKDWESFSLTQLEPEQKKMLEVLNVHQYALRG
ncbi:MAG: IS1634 family transposase [Armatimonadota bacterium]